MTARGGGYSQGTAATGFPRDAILAEANRIQRKCSHVCTRVHICIRVWNARARMYICNAYGTLPALLVRERAVAAPFEPLCYSRALHLVRSSAPPPPLRSPCIPALSRFASTPPSPLPPAWNRNGNPWRSECAKLRRLRIAVPDDEPASGQVDSILRRLRRYLPSRYPGCARRYGTRE